MVKNIPDTVSIEPKSISFSVRDSSGEICFKNIPTNQIRINSYPHS